MISRALAHVTSHKPPYPSLLLSKTPPFSSSPDSSIIARLHHKDWLTPKEVTHLVNSLTHPSNALTLLTLYSSRKDYNPTEPFSISIITKLSQAKLFDPIETFVQSLKLCSKNPLSELFFFTLIRIYAHMFNRIDKVIDTLFAMPNFQCWPSPRTFNFVLNLLVSSKLYEVAHEVYVAAPRLGVEVDACCLNILIKGLCECGKLEAAFEVFDEFPKMGCEPNVRTYATLMHGLCEKGMVDDAFGLLGRMERSGVCADAVVFNVLIGGLRKQGRVDEGKEVLERMMMEKGCDPNESSYQEVLYGLLDAERFGEAKEMMEKMVLEGFGPSFVSYKVMVKGLCKGKMVGEVDWAVRQMVRRGFVPRMGMWRQIVKCLVSQERSSNVVVSFDGILED